MSSWIRNLFGKKEKSTASAANTSPGNVEAFVPDREPDLPCPFGYKTSWYAIKNETSLSVIEKLSLDVVSEANWKSGFNYTYRGDGVFVSPEIDGYVLVANLPDEVADDDFRIVKNNAEQFNELQYFVSNHIVDFYGWVKFSGRQVVRAYVYAGDQGELLWNEGALTDEELKLGLDQFSISETWNEDDTYPGEDEVMNIAKAWGIDTTFYDKPYDKSTGYVCRFKNS